jgi:predicted Rossmann fold nucleotide-binding protein DprA/Smf involved in DNA uptake
MEIGITGSRDCHDKELVYSTLAQYNPTAIVAGGAAGADALAKQYAIDSGIGYVEILPRFKTDPDTPYHPRWYLERNKEIVAACDLLLAFWDGKSKGTKNTIGAAQRQGKPCVIVNITENPQHQNQTMDLFSCQ